jgi:hypothetical protein
MNANYNEKRLLLLLFINYIQGIYHCILVTKQFAMVYNFADILSLKFMVNIMKFPTINYHYYYYYYLYYYTSNKLFLSQAQN